MEEIKKFKENPFSVRSPEDMSAEEVFSLFVDVMTDFPKVLSEGHTFLHGPRGSGKSMIFRYLEPDCQMLSHRCKLKNLPFFSIYLTIKNTALTELQRLENKHATVVLNEHFMVFYVLQRAFQKMSMVSLGDDTVLLDEVRLFIKEDFFKPLRASGWKNQPPDIPDLHSISEYFNWLKDISESLYKEFLEYVRRLSFAGDIPSYYGPLCGYLDFLLPLLIKLKNLSFMPSGPIYLLIDDGDNLTLTQTKILNSWVASRTSSKVSIKISTQLKYKSYRSVAGHLIETPHDYSEINISTIYTSSHKKKYFERIGEIVTKRLKIGEINISPNDFFPENKEQEERIKVIAEEYRQAWKKGEGRGYRASDDVTRYARPDYMKNLAGTAKSSYTYYYAGFDQLVHLSSGIIRNFLEAASKMYAEAKIEHSQESVKLIDPSIQNKVVRQIADELIFDAFDKLHDEQDEESPDDDLLGALANLIKALGGTFQLILHSDRSERRVFSIAFSDDPTPKLKKVLALGVELGYFHVSSIGNKEGTGRTRLYILDRRLAPHFKLDPTSFAGYLFVTSAAITEALRNPETLFNRVKKKGVDDVFEEKQLNLF